jgi:hypothetical protein
MVRYHKAARHPRPEKSCRAYELIVRGPDGRPRCEQFTDASAYRARLRRLKTSTSRSLSIDEIAALLDS